MVTMVYYCSVIIDHLTKRKLQVTLNGEHLEQTALSWHVFRAGRFIDVTLTKMKFLGMFKTDCFGCL